MQLEYSISTRQEKSSIEKALLFFSTPIALAIIDECPEVKSKGSGLVLSIAIVGKKRMQTLNSQYRSKDSSTDVLSFELFENGVMGELYICPDDIKKNARMMNNTIEREFIEICIHGILHVAGYDHEKVMFDWQKKLTERILNTYENHSRVR